MELAVRRPRTLTEAEFNMRLGEDVNLPYDPDDDKLHDFMERRAVYDAASQTALIEAVAVIARRNDLDNKRRRLDNSSDPADMRLQLEQKSKECEEMRLQLEEERLQRVEERQQRDDMCRQMEDMRLELEELRSGRST